MVLFELVTVVPSGGLAIVRGLILELLKGASLDTLGAAFGLFSNGNVSQRAKGHAKNQIYYSPKQNRRFCWDFDSATAKK